MNITCMLSKYLWNGRKPRYIEKTLHRIYENLHVARYEIEKEFPEWRINCLWYD